MSRADGSSNETVIFSLSDGLLFTIMDPRFKFVFFLLWLTHSYPILINSALASAGQGGHLLALSV